MYITVLIFFTKGAGLKLCASGGEAAAVLLLWLWLGLSCAKVARLVVLLRGMKVEEAKCEMGPSVPVKVRDRLLRIDGRPVSWWSRSWLAPSRTLQTFYDYFYFRI